MGQYGKSHYFANQMKAGVPGCKPEDLVLYIQ